MNLHSTTVQARRARVLPAIFVATLVAICFIPLRRAVAQVETTYAEEPTHGLHLPGVGLAGEHDAFSVAQNPAGLRFLRGFHLGLGLDIEPEGEATSAGPGVGLYLGDTLGGGLMPQMGLGLGLEVLRPSRAYLAPDPGTPARLTLAYAVPFGRTGALGISYHRFFDDAGMTTSGLATWDLGFAARLGARLAMGGVIRDLGSPAVSGVPVQRRYELELLTRPLATDRLELALGGRIGEIRADVDAWLRLSARITRGVYLRGQLESRELTVIETSPTGMRDLSEREHVLSAGLEISFGGLGAVFTGTAGRSAAGESRFRGSTVLVRMSSEHIPSVLAQPGRIERVEVAGAMDERKLTLLVLRLRAIARDPAVAAVLLPIDDLDAGWATIQEIRRELLRVRQTGKPIFAYLIAASMRDYYLATAATKIYLDPGGGVWLTGIAGTTMYFKGMFAKLGVSAQFEKIEEYKSAPESWTHEWPTEPAQRMRTAIFDSLYTSVIAHIAESRGMTTDDIRKLVDQGPYTAGDLGKSRLIDAVATPDDIGKLVVKELGAAYAVATAPPERPERWTLPAIAVIHIDGDIVDGQSQTIPVLDRRLVGGETIAQAIAAARSHPEVKAIVLRINSPGGSALASEMMAREVFKTRGVKPIICSMGDVAASGGYYAAAGCDVIFAESMTITGSIGIFYGKFDFSTLLAKIGVTWATEKRGEHADIESYFRPYTAEERALVKDKIRYLYKRFIDTVAEGRGISAEEVNEVGRGRVWTGAQAKDVRLVDRLGGLADAIEFARARVGLGEKDRARVIQLPTARTSLLGVLLGSAGLHTRAETGLSLGLLPGAEVLLQAIPASLWAGPDVPQARLPFAIVWH